MASKSKPKDKNSAAQLRGENMRVPIELITPNRWNPNVQSDFMFERERRSIRKFGFIDDVTVREIRAGKSVTYEIIDGEHRWKAAKLEGLAEVTVKNLGTVPDEEAKTLTDILNNLRGEPDPEKQGKLITELQEFPELVEILPYTETQLEHFMKVSEFDWEEQQQRERDAAKEAGAGRGRSKGMAKLEFRVPKDAKKIIDRAVNAVMKETGTDNPGRALELLCGDYLAGPGVRVQESDEDTGGESSSEEGAVEEPGKGSGGQSEDEAHSAT